MLVPDEVPVGFEAGVMVGFVVAPVSVFEGADTVGLVVCTGLVTGLTAVGVGFGFLTVGRRGTLLR
jgi:hypothetical protein